MTLDELKAKADVLGIEYGARIGAKALENRIAEAEVVEPTPAAEGADAAPVLAAPQEDEPDAKVDVEPVEGQVKVRITKKGDGQVFDGKGGKFAWKDTPNLPLKSAQSLEDKGWAEIE